MKSLWLSLAIGAILAAVGFAQSNESMDRIIASEALDYGKAAYLVLVASDNIAEDAGEARSFEMIRDLKWISVKATVDASINLGEFAYILMRAFGMKGGIMYSIAPGPRYAFRELVSRRVIQGRADPANIVSGQKAIHILGRILDLMEGAK